MRKYAYAWFWEDRLSSGEPITHDDIDEWKRFMALEFMGSVAFGVVGDAARLGLLSERQIGELLAGELNPYAERALRARRLLLRRRQLDQPLINALLDHRAAWALHELLATPLSPDELAVVGQAATDTRLYRRERHRLREALQRRARPDTRS